MSGHNRALEQINAMRRKSGVAPIPWPNKPYGKGTRAFARGYLIRELKVWKEVSKLLGKRKGVA
jgi:hypothetical protein